MRQQTVEQIVFFVLSVIVAIVVILFCTGIFQVAFNYVMPFLFNLKEISLLQAFALIIVVNGLFGGIIYAASSKK